ncbi:MULTISPECIES: hypothetical protein [unclassified Bradyrhizobium]
MRALVVRLPDHAGAEREAGLSVVADQQQKVEERLGEIDDRIENLEVGLADVPQKVAALLTITADYARGPGDWFGRTAVLDAVRPLLTGLIREHAEYVAAANCDERMDTMPFWSSL